VVAATFKVTERYRSSDIMLFTSKSEGFPRVVMESMLCGVPVVAIENTGGHQEMIDHGINGWLTSLEQLSETVIQALKKKEGLLSMGKNGREKILANYSFEKHYEKYSKLTEELSQGQIKK